MIILYMDWDSGAAVFKSSASSNMVGMGFVGSGLLSEADGEAILGQLITVLGFLLLSFLPPFGTRNSKFDLGKPPKFNELSFFITRLSGLSV